MHVALRLGVVSFYCALSACGPFWHYAVRADSWRPAVSRPKVDPLTVEVFWFSLPTHPFDVLGTITVGREMTATTVRSANLPTSPG